MKQSAFPAKFALPFAGSAGASYIRTIPQASQVGVTAGAASLADGFPPVTFDPVSAGGTPPSGADMNGILNWITSVLQAYQSGYFGLWDGSFATAIGGYPMNAIVSGAAAGTYYVSTTDDNMTTPGAAGASWQSLFAGLVLPSDLAAEVARAKGVEAELQPLLGYTPVQQNGGSNMATNKLYLGWAKDGSSRLLVQVDATLQSPIRFLNDTMPYAFFTRAQNAQQVATTLAFTPSRSGIVVLNANFGCDNTSATVESVSYGGDTTSYTNIGGMENTSASNLWVSNRLFAVTAGKPVSLGMVATISAAANNLQIGGSGTFIATS